MKVVIDTETNSLTNPTEIFCIVCKDIDTGRYYRFRNLVGDPIERQHFEDFSKKVSTWIGHNLLDYDYPVIKSLLVLDLSGERIDTLIVSRMVDYSRSGGHSIEEYGLEYNFPKIKIDYRTFTKWSQEMADYCQRDVDICHKIYLEHLKFITECSDAVRLEHEFQLVVNALHDRGFCFNTKKAEKLLAKVQEELDALDKQIALSFPAKLYPIKEIHPRATIHGTLNKNDFRWLKGGDLSKYAVDAPFTRCEWRPFNASSHRQIISVLHSAGWVPIDKTDTHVETERELNRLKFSKKPDKELDLTNLRAKLMTLEKYGWRVNENNLSTLPTSAPAPARTLARRILFESRRRTLTEWLGLVRPDTDRIHGSFVGIGAWTHRMAHRKPNMANIPNEFKEDGTKKLLGKELRQLWIAPKNRLLVGVDAEGIQLRIFAHYIDDQEFTDALVRGEKVKKTDPHSLNQRIIGSVCRTRQAAKRFIYALLLGGGLPKLAFILDCSIPEAETALNRLLERYTGFATLKKTQIPADAGRGYFIGLDGRKVAIPGQTLSERKHLCMSGYLQNGEAIVMKKAALIAEPQFKDLDSFFVDIVHDDMETETPNNMEIALQVAKIKADAIKAAGEFYKLKCPLAGSFYNEDHKDYTIGTNMYQIH